MAYVEEAEYTPEEVKLMETHDLSEDEFDDACSNLQRLIRDYGTETVNALTEHLGNTFDDWY